MIKNLSKKFKTFFRKNCKISKKKKQVKILKFLLLFILQQFAFGDILLKKNTIIRSKRKKTKLPIGFSNFQVPLYDRRLLPNL